MFRLFECCALSFFERFVLSFSLKIERFVSDSAEIWICGLYKKSFDEEGNWAHEEILLLPKNSIYSPIVIEEENADEFRIVGEFIGVLQTETK